jgi:hypothetical protein
MVFALWRKEPSNPPTCSHYAVVTIQGETGEKWHFIPLPLVTASGIQVGKWVELLVSIWALEGRVRGPAFCDAAGKAGGQIQ